MKALALAQVLTADLAGAVAVLLGFTGLAAGAVRYGAILKGRSEEEIEVATAHGFFAGLTIGILGLGLDSIA